MTRGVGEKQSIITRRTGDDVLPMQQAHGRGQFTWSARKLSADVDAPFAVTCAISKHH